MVSLLTFFLSTFVFISCVSLLHSESNTAKCLYLLLFHHDALQSSLEKPPCKSDFTSNPSRRFTSNGYTNMQAGALSGFLPGETVNLVCQCTPVIPISHPDGKIIYWRFYGKPGTRHTTTQTVQTTLTWLSQLHPATSFYCNGRKNRDARCRGQWECKIQNNDPGVTLRARRKRLLSLIPNSSNADPCVLLAGPFYQTKASEIGPSTIYFQSMSHFLQHWWKKWSTIALVIHMQHCQ